MQTPINDNGFRDIRLLGGVMALVTLALHFYYSCYRAFEMWRLTNPFVDRLITNMARSGFLSRPLFLKFFILIFIVLTLVGKVHYSGLPTKIPKLRIALFCFGIIGYFGSGWLMLLDGNIQVIAVLYMMLSLSGLTFLYRGMQTLAGLIRWGNQGDIFNRYNESFPQEERLIANPTSLNFRARYRYRNRTRDSWVNITSVFRGIMVVGQSGSGKSFYIIRQIIYQHLEKGFSLFVFDFKFDDLTRLTWNMLREIEAKAQKSKTPTQLKKKRSFFVINFDDLSKTNRCNPLDPANMDDISDATESSRTILLALNRDWIHRQGDFFVESAIAFIAANIWFLRKYEDGKYCTLPHLIEIIQCDYSQLFSVLRSFKELQSIINTFVSAFLANSMDQLEGQVASARIALSALSSPQLYYVLSGNEFSLDINNPEDPKVVCMGSSPAKNQVYGAVISLFVTRMHKLINRKNCEPCTLIYDEAPTLYTPGLDLLMATGRSQKICVVLGIQSIDQLRKNYGKTQGDAIFNLPGNVVCGGETGDTARMVSELFGRTLQEKTSVSTNSRDSSTSQSLSLDLAVPASKIASLSAGEFVGVVADNPSQKIDLKLFNCEIVVDFKAVKKADDASIDLPIIRENIPGMAERTFDKIKEDVLEIVENRLAHMAKTPALARLIVKKPEGFNPGRRTF